MEGATESEKNALKGKEEKKAVKFEDLDGSGVTQNSEVVEDLLRPVENRTPLAPETHIDISGQ